MPARNLSSMIEKFLVRFYPDATDAEKVELTMKIAGWIRGKLGPGNKGISTRKLEAMYAAEHKDDPSVKPRRKLGEDKKFWEFYVLKGLDIVAGPFVDRTRAETVAAEKSGKVLTATEAKRRGYLARYVPAETYIPF